MNALSIIRFTSLLEAGKQMILKIPDVVNYYLKGATPELSRAAKRFRLE